MKKKEYEEEIALTEATADTDVEIIETEETDVKEVKLVENRQSKQSFIKRFNGLLDTAKGGVDTINEFYTSWIKPIYDNRAQITRRLNAVSTAISIIFFLMYIPFLLFGKLYKDLALGWDIALYACIGVYLLTLLVLLIVTIASGKINTTTMAKRRKKTSKVILLIVRIASLAIAITALVISSANGSEDGRAAIADTVAIVFAVMSIIFSSMPLIFGGLGGFVKWLISPAKAKYKFNFVALEWYSSLSSDKQMNKNLKKAVRRYGERFSILLDNYFLPALGKKLISTLDRTALTNFLDSIPDEDLNLAEWMVKEIFDYAEECGYIKINPCGEMDLEADIGLDTKSKKKPLQDEKPSVLGKLSSLFTRKK